MKKGLFYFYCLFSSSLFAQIPTTCTQAILVLADTKASTTGIMKCFEKDNENWREVGFPIEVSFGKNGLAWSHGSHGKVPQNQIPRKEGSLTSPLGIYSIHAVFGLKALLNEESYSLPYIHFTQELVAVDDPSSVHYNKIVDKNIETFDWTSAEDLSQIPGYRYGAIIGFNPDPVDLSAGSAIFLHVWRAPGYPTAGCTAMSEENMHQLAHWFLAEKNPVLIQLTKADYLQYKKIWNLPEIHIE